MSVQTGFTITQKQEGATAVSLYPQGDVDVDSSVVLKKSLDSCFSKGFKQIHVVLDGVPRMDSSGIATLVEGLRWSRKSGHRFVLSGMTEAVEDLFELSSLKDEFEIQAAGESR